MDYVFPYYLLFQSLAELLYSMLYEACCQYHLEEDFELHREPLWRDADQFSPSPHKSIEGRC